MKAHFMQQCVLFSFRSRATNLGVVILGRRSSEIYEVLKFGALRNKFARGRVESFDNIDKSVNIRVGYTSHPFWFKLCHTLLTPLALLANSHTTTNPHPLVLPHFQLLLLTVITASDPLSPPLSSSPFFLSQLNCQVQYPFPRVTIAFSCVQPSQPSPPLP